MIIGKLIRELAERVGFEPTLPCGKHAFQACAFSHSAISPEKAGYVVYESIRARACMWQFGKSAVVVETVYFPAWSTV